MFPRLADFVKNPQTIIDVGCGYGVPSVWLLELFPQARIYGIEPDEKRVRIASRAIANRGHIDIGKAPTIPYIPYPADTALLLDIIHHLNDDEFLLTLQRLHNNLHPDGSLIIRATVPSEKRFPWKRWIEKMSIKTNGRIPHYRSERQIQDIITLAGYNIACAEINGPHVEEWWFVATIKRGVHEG